MNNINQEIEDLEATLVSLKAKAKAKAKEPTLTPVSFESKGELAKALIDGRTFKTSGTHTLMYNDSCSYLSPFRAMRDGEDQGPMKGVWYSYADLQEINAAPAEPWYLNIPPEGVECYVSDSNATPAYEVYGCASSITLIVTQYKQGLTQPFQCAHGRWTYAWKYATPVNEGK